MQVIDGVELTTEARWWGHTSTITGRSDFPIPERMILFVSQRGMDHGFWRDLEVGDAAFDARFFIFSDQPALLAIVCGAATRSALVADDIELYVRDKRVTTTSVAAKGDEAARERHVAVHRALAEDHRAFLGEWKQRMDSAAGRADLVWPPTGTLLRPSGALLVNLAWSGPAGRDGSDWAAAAASMRTEITAHDDRERVRWSLLEVSPTMPCTHVLAKRRFNLTGTLPFALAQLESIVRQGELSSVAVHANRITVGVRGVARAGQIDAAVRIIGLVVQATAETSSPYR